MLAKKTNIFEVSPSQGRPAPSTGAFEIKLESFDMRRGMSKLVESMPTKAMKNSHYVQQVTIWNNAALAANPALDLSSQVSETHVFAGMYVNIHYLTPAENPLRLCLWGVVNLLRSNSGMRTLTQTGKAIINCSNSRRGGSIDFQFATNPLMELSYAIQFAVFGETVQVLMPSHLLHHKDFAHWLGAVERSFMTRVVHQLDPATWKALQKQFSSAARKLNSYAKRSK